MNNNVIKKQFDSIGSNFDVVPQYNVFKQKYSSEEKLLLSELRENLVDLATCKCNCSNYECPYEKHQIFSN